MDVCLIVQSSANHISYDDSWQVATLSFAVRLRESRRPYRRRSALLCDVEPTLFTERIETTFERITLPDKNL